MQGRDCKIKNWNKIIDKNIFFGIENYVQSWSSKIDVPIEMDGHSGSHETGTKVVNHSTMIFCCVE